MIYTDKTFYIKTFGCQMNERDSEQITGFLLDAGFSQGTEDNCDLIIINTCTVRENANNKLYGHLGLLKSQKQKKKDLKIAICGCMMQEDGVKDTIKEKYPFVDLIFGTGNIEKFPLLLDEIMSDKKVYDTENFEEIDKPSKNKNHKFPFKSGVNIVFGCDNFCSYCIVPYVRGREKSRESKDIIDEIKSLADDGVTEIMLLGQNVNSYGKNLDEKISFSDLLKEVEKIEKIKRIRFMTSHPKDFSDDLIDAIKHSKKICRHIHLPLQSGSSRILEKMNRKYDKEKYIKLCQKIRNEIPGVSITTDIIVGFPGETNEDVLETMDVIKTVQFDSAFTFIYSKRSGTPAAKMEQVLSNDEIQENFDKVLSLVQETSKKQLEKAVGNTEVVLVEHLNERDNTLVTGRTDTNFNVHFKGDKSLIGQYITVKLIESKGFYFMGEIV